MNILLSSRCDPLPSIHPTLVWFGAWIQGESIGGWPFNCEGIVISPTVSFFAAHITVPDLQGGCFYRVDRYHYSCGVPNRNMMSDLESSMYYLQHGTQTHSPLG